MEYNINGFKIKKPRHIPITIGDASNIQFNLIYRDKAGKEVKGFRRKDVRRIVLEDGRELSHSIASNELTLIGRIKNMDANLSDASSPKIGGYSRKWMDAYRALVNKKETFKNIPKELVDVKMEYFIKGYEDACKTFEDYANGRHK